MAQDIRTVNLARSTVSCRCHVCAFFHSREDEYKVMMPFFEEGLGAGDSAIFILDKNQRSERLQQLAETIVDTAGAEASGQLCVRTWEDGHLQSGRFDQHAMIDLLEEIATAGAQRGTGITRLWVNMEWALQDCPGVHDILEYELRVNDILPKYDIATVCAYDVTKFSASLVTDVLRTHPQVIVGGILRENPFYVPPDDFLRELGARNVLAAE